MSTKYKAFLAEIIPLGISLTFAVLGLEASMLRSKYRLKAIAAERANTIQAITSKSNFISKVEDVVFKAKKKPMHAKGKAKIV